jgi:hypothetical protein
MHHEEPRVSQKPNIDSRYTHRRIDGEDGSRKLRSKGWAARDKGRAIIGPERILRVRGSTPIGRKLQSVPKTIPTLVAVQTNERHFGDRLPLLHSG